MRLHSERGRNQAMITVGMPVCNAMPWLPEAMESLLRQTVDDFAILAIVDGGTDGSAEYLRSLRDPRLRVVEQENAGVTATLNRLLAEAQTPWLVRQDADDVSYPTRIEKLQTAIRAHPEAGLIYSLADYYPRDRCAGQFRCSRGTSEELRSMVAEGYLLSICHSTVALNVEKARAAGGYRMDLHAEDADLWWRMARRHAIEFVPEALVGFRQNAASVSARHLREQQLAAIYVQYLLLSELWGWRPRPLAAIAPTLGQLMRERGVTAKEWLRRGNMHFADRRWMRGAAAVARAAWTSPRYVARRAWDEVRPMRITNGVAPRLFLERKEALWL